MFYNSMIRYGLPFLGGVTAVGFILKKYCLDESEEVNEVLFFSNQGITCKEHFQKELSKKPCSSKECSYFNLRRMLYYINKAEESLDICLYLITVSDLCEAIIQLHKKGVKVRVITDEDMANGSGSKIQMFFKNGIAVRHKRKCTTLMHHKFVIIDRQLVMTGSLNWTMQAICGNWDNLIITSHAQILSPFIIEFEKLWHNMGV